MTRDAGHAVRLTPRVERIADLTRTQSDIWTSQRLHPTTPLANMGKRTRIEGRVDAQRFVRAFDAVVRSCEALRTVVGERHAATAHDDRRDRAVALVRAAPPASTEIIELPVGELEPWCRERISTPIDATNCVYDSVLIRHADDDWTWWLDLHHIATDAWASALIFEATSVAYEHGGPDVDLSDVIDGSFYPELRPEDDDGGPDDASVAERRAAWREEIEAAGPQPPIEPYGARGPRTTLVTRRSLPFSNDDRQRLQTVLDSAYRTLSRELGLLTISAMSAAITVHRLDGRTSVLLGVPVHHRSAPAARSIVGPLMELYPLAVEVVPGETHEAMFRRVMASIVSLLRRAKPGESPHAGFEIVLNVLTARYGRFAGMPAVSEWMRSGHVDPAHVLRSQVFDYTADPSATSGLTDLQWELDVNTSLSADGAADRLPEHFAAVVHHVIDGPSEPVGARSIVDDAELAELAALTPDPAVRHHTEPVHEQIARRLRAHPTWIVAEHGADRMSAAQLDQRADDLARWLIDAGITGGRAVGIRMERGLDALVAIHGVLRAGGAFVMLSPDEPPARLATISADADLLLTLQELPDQPASSPGPGLPSVDLDDRAYVLYTSGSTGTPKGVPISHRGLADYLEFAVHAYVDEPGPVVALHSRLTVDLTITSLFLSFLTDGLTVVFDAEPITALGQIAADDRISFLKATPSQLELFVRLADRPRPLRTIVVGGEAFRTPIARRTIESCAPGVRIYNEYGPTEAVVGCMIHRFDADLDAGTDVPIGHAAPGGRVAVLDPFGQPTPTGAWGELYVQRPGMAEGYLGRPELTAERFVTVAARLGPADSAVDPGRPWYRTGDRARVVRPGIAVYGGRMDEQIKVEGMRLEPGEVEAALVSFPAITAALVRMWQPNPHDSLLNATRCVRCGLGTDVPGLELDGDAICNVCRSFDMVAPQTERWFRSEADLDDRLDDARRRRRGEVDCLHLLSGGKDSTYALYQLVERGWRVHALTLDNGFISDGAKENIRRSVADLGITHEFVTTSAMNDIFRDSLDRYSNVCQGCYKTIYTLAIARAHELGIPVIVTGLSRGQFFETRLVPHQFELGRFDPDAIDETVLEARRVYHRTEDAVTRLLPEQRVVNDDGIFDEIEFVDFYRYVDVPLDELYRYLEERAPWVRPADTGRSTNCLINIAGIQVHRAERGYHNYAEPYAWDVRLGHKTREEALEELDDEVDEAEVLRLLAEVGYEPKSRGVLTAWYRSVDGNEVDPDAVREHLRDRLPAHAVPAAFVRLDEIPLAASAKADPTLLPAPTRFHRSSGAHVEPSTALEARLAEIWAEVLGLEMVGVTEDFFEIGGASLDALEVVEAIDTEFGADLPDAAVFRSPTVRALAVVVERALDADGDAGPGPIEELDADRPVPLSAGEEAMLLEHRLASDDPRYNVNRIYRIELRSEGGHEFDVAAFRDAVGDIVMAHGPLHTSYGARRHPLPLDAALSWVELPDMDPDEFERVAAAQRARPFDLEAGPLVRVHLARTGPRELSLLVGLHHISIDAGTFDLLWDQIVDRYAAGAMPELRTTYAAHGEWQRDQREEAAAFWLERSRRRRASGGLGLAAPSPQERDGYLSTRCSVAPDVLTGPGSTPFATAMAAVAVVVSRFAGDGRVPFGITASTKDHRDAAPLLGYYLNTLPVELDVRPAERFADLVGEAASFVAEALPHRTYPFASMVRDARAAGYAAPTISCMLAYEDLATPRLPGAEVEQRILASGSSVADVTFFVQERATSLQLGLEYRGAVIGRSDAERMMALFESVLLDGATDPGRSVGALVEPSGAPDVEGAFLAPSDGTVLDDIMAQVETQPGAPAVATADGATLSYRELAETAHGLLTAADRATPGRNLRRVGVLLDRSTDLVAALLAAQCAGAAYVPLDPTAPPERLAGIAELADLDVVITRRELDISADLLGVPAHRVIGVEDAVRVEGDIEDLRTRIDRVGPDDDAYVIFTSGSTGRPRGVEITHRNLAASTRARGVWYSDAPSKFLVTPSIGFDSSIVGLFWPLTTGGTVVLPTDDDVRDVDRLGATIAAHGVTHTLMVPSLHRALLERCPGELAGLRTAIVAGEACSAALVELHQRLLPDVALFNEYGPTEGTVWATAARLVGDDEVSIGLPIPGTTVRIVDRYLSSVPAGVAGELLISGPGIAKGYLDDEAATAARFVTIDGRRWYRTGDVVRARGTGIEFIGRADDQLNVGGTRLEPGEVEAALTMSPDIRDAVVVAALDPPILVAHVESDRFDEADLRERLTQRLPAGSIPRRFVRHRRLPRNANGKVDRAAATELPIGPTGGQPTKRAAVPERSTIGLVLGAWRTALERPDIEPDSDFFAVGGDSLSAVEVVTTIGEGLGRPVPIAALLTGRTPRGMTELLDGAEAAEAADAPAAHTDSPAFQTVSLRPGDAAGPLIVMTPAWDDVFAYQALASAFPADHTVLALAYLEQPGDPVVTTVDELVREFLPRAAAAIGDRSSVAILGWSVGGLVAVELAERLSGTGRPVELVALIDTFFPGEERHLWSNRWSKYKSLLRPGSFGEAGRELRVMGTRRLKRLAGRLGRRLLRWSGATVPSEPERTSVGGFPKQALAHDVDRLDIPLVFYRASTTNPARTLVKWRTVAGDVVDVEVPGRHRGFNSIMGPKGVALIAADLTDRLGDG